MTRRKRREGNRIENQHGGKAEIKGRRPVERGRKDVKVEVREEAEARNHLEGERFRWTGTENASRKWNDTLDVNSE